MKLKEDLEVYVVIDEEGEIVKVFLDSDDADSYVYSKNQEILNDAIEESGRDIEEMSPESISEFAAYTEEYVQSVRVELSKGMDTEKDEIEIDDNIMRVSDIFRVCQKSRFSGEDDVEDYEEGYEEDFNSDFEDDMY